MGNCRATVTGSGKTVPRIQARRYVTLAVPAAISKQATFATIAAVEQYVEGHYLRQIERIGADNPLQHLRSVLIRCCEDEIRHKNDAKSRLKRPDSWLEKLWPAVISAGSAITVGVARRI